MRKLLQLGVDPGTLFDKFRERTEQREAQQDDTRQIAHEQLTQDLNPREYRLAREAEASLVAEPDVPLEDMSYSDYRAVREAEQNEETPRSYLAYREELLQRKEST